MKKLFLLLAFCFLFQYRANAGICGSLTDLKAALCHVAKFYFPKLVPESAVALYFIDRFFDAQSNAWKDVKKDVEKYVDDALTGARWIDIDSWHKSMIARVNTCKLKQNKAFKISCLKNLHEDLSGYEPKFRGYLRKEKALFLKFYDIFTITYLAVSDELRDLTDDAKLKASIDRDVSAKAKIFVTYLEDALPQARLYACRHIKVSIEKDNGLWWSFEKYWPDDIEKVVVPSVFDKRSLATEDIDNDMGSNPLLYRGCGVFKKSVEFRSTIYDTKNKKTLKGGPWRYDACSKTEGISRVLFSARFAWNHYTKQCTEKLKTNFWLNMEDRIVQLKKLIKS